MNWKGALRLVNKAASKVKDIEAIGSGDPQKIARRIKNKAKGKMLNKLGFWRW